MRRLLDEEVTVHRIPIFVVEFVVHILPISLTLGCGMRIVGVKFDGMPAEGHGGLNLHFMGGEVVVSLYPHLLSLGRSVAAGW